MTLLHKPIARRTSLDPRLGGKDRGEVTVTLYPDNMIGFRKLKRRHEVKLSLEAVYALAIKSEAKALVVSRVKKRMARRGITSGSQLAAALRRIK